MPRQGIEHYKLIEMLLLKSVHGGIRKVIQLGDP